MQHDKNKLAISAAKLYYQSNFSQVDIAKEMKLSRPSVSRLLQYAKDKGFVRIEIFDPIEDQSQLAQKVAAAYGLRDVCIANAPIEDEEEIKNTSVSAAPPMSMTSFKTATSSASAGEQR